MHAYMERNAYRNSECACVCVHTPYVYYIHSACVCAHSAFQQEQPRLVSNLTATGRLTWGNLSLVLGMKHRALKPSSVIFPLVLGAS